MLRTPVKIHIPALIVLIAVSSLAFGAASANADLSTSANASVRSNISKGHAALTRSLRAQMSRAGCCAGAYVYDLTAKQSLFKSKASKRRILASNAKLFTTAAGLARFGPAAVIETDLLTTGPAVEGVLQGDVYLRGGGDPTFGSAKFTSRLGGNASVESLAAQVAALGIVKVKGRVYGDDSRFDALRGTAPYGYSPHGEMGGQLSALIYSRGFLKGKFQSDPPRSAARELAKALEREDVDVVGGAGVAATPAGAQEIAQVVSQPFSRIAALTNKASDNFIAEMMLKLIASGPEGANGVTTSQGALWAQQYAAKAGTKVALVDGSGLSRGDLASPVSVVRLLRFQRSRANGEWPAFWESLAVAGQSGTLSQRMRGSSATSACRGKTGTLSNVSALSGYCTARNGHLIAFSFVMNRTWPAGARAVQDKMTIAIAKFDG